MELNFRQQFHSFLRFSIISVLIIILVYFFLYLLQATPQQFQFYVFMSPILSIASLYFVNTTRFPLVKTLNRSWMTLTEPFHVFVDEKVIQFTVDIARILAGSAMLFTFVDSLSYAILLDSSPQSIVPLYLGYIILSVFYIFGFFTPLLSLIFLLFSLYFAPFPFGILLLRLTLLAGIFLGAGRSLSIDYLLQRTKPFGIVINLVYSLTPTLSQSYYANIRFLLFVIFWGVNFTTMLGHWNDSYWRNGDAITLLLTMPFFSDWYQLFISARDSNPLLFHSLAIVSLALQSLYEFFTLPLSFFKLGRMFIAFQMLAFTFVVFFLMNIASQVASIQLTIWLLLFLPELLLFLNVIKRKDSDSPVGKTDENLPRLSKKHLFHLIFVMSLYLAAVHMAIQTLVFIGFVPMNIYQNEWIMLSFRGIGLAGAINVFNTVDIEASQNYIVLAEINDDDRLIRVVPFTDINGGRLSYLRADYALYRIFLPWQRQPMNEQFPNQEGISSENLRSFIRQQVLYDACFQNLNEPHRYFAFAFTMPIEQEDYFRVYSGDSTLYALMEYQLTLEDIEHIMSRRNSYGMGIGCYNLPPNHFYSEVRAEQSLAYLVAYLENFFEDGRSLIKLN